MSNGNARIVLRTASRLVRVGVHFGWGWLQAALVLPKVGPVRRTALVQSWCLKMLQIAGVTVQETGPRPPRSVMLVSNHVSWLDMIAIQSLCESRFVAKSEVRSWPVIGSMASRLGTVYIDRGSSRSASRVVGQVAALLRAGEVIVIFPEGTTTDGSKVQPFRGSLLQAPIDARASVQPVALTYRETGSGLPCARASYSGEDGLLESIWRTVSRQVTVRLAFGPIQVAHGQDRRSLALALHSTVDALRKLGPCENPFSDHAPANRIEPR